MRVLLVEDDPMIGAALVGRLEDDAYAVDWVRSAEPGLDSLLTHNYDVVLLDLGLPELDGAGFLAKQRARGDRTPVIVVTARSEVDSRISSLDLGADDYLVKPFAYEELLARLRALGRRPPSRKSSALKAGPIELDETTRRVTVAGKPVDLSQREFSILECLLRRPGQVLSRDQLLDYAWPYGVALTPNTVEAYIHLLREKLGHDAAARVETVRGVGYRLREA